MSITPEQAAEMQNRVNALRLKNIKAGKALDQVAKESYGVITSFEFMAVSDKPGKANAPNPARPHNSKTIDELNALVTPEGLAKTEKRMMRELKKKKQNPEYQIQAEYVLQMADKYPLVMVFSDTAAHIGKTMFQQIRANKLQSAIAKDWPDVFVAHPSGDYAGLFLEFKAKSPYLKDGVTLSSDKHIRDQAATMDRLRERGYFCAFVWEVGQAFNLTNKYLNL